MSACACDQIKRLQKKQKFQYNLELEIRFDPTIVDDIVLSIIILCWYDIYYI